MLAATVYNAMAYTYNTGTRDSIQVLWTGVERTQRRSEATLRLAGQPSRSHRSVRVRSGRRTLARRGRNAERISGPSVRGLSARLHAHFGRRPGRHEFRRISGPVRGSAQQRSAFGFQGIIFSPGSIDNSDNSYNDARLDMYRRRVQRGVNWSRFLVVQSKHTYFLQGSRPL